MTDENAATISHGGEVKMAPISSFLADMPTTKNPPSQSIRRTIIPIVSKVSFCKTDKTKFKSHGFNRWAHVGYPCNKIAYLWKISPPFHAHLELSQYATNRVFMGIRFPGCNARAHKTPSPMINIPGGRLPGFQHCRNDCIQDFLILQGLGFSSQAQWACDSSSLMLRNTLKQLNLQDNVNLGE